MTNQRINYIDVARGIAIICIIIGHMGLFAINRVVFTFHVPIFFMITGYLTDTSQPVEKYIKKLFKKLLIPYIVTCVVIILLGGLREALLQETGSVKQVVWDWTYASLYGAGTNHSEPIYIKQIGALWFLWASFWGSLFWRWSLNFKKGIRIAFLFVIFVLGIWSRRVAWLPFSIQPGCIAAFYIYVGYMCKQNHEVIHKLSAEAKAAGVLFMSSIWVAFMVNYKSFGLVACDIGRGIIDIFSSLCACYMVILISKQVNKYGGKIAQFLRFMGKNSILVLCIHIVELNIFPWWKVTGKLVQFGMNPDIQKPLVAITKLIFIILATIILSRFTIVQKIYGLSAEKRVKENVG